MSTGECKPMQRLFFALWPDHEVRNRINRLACELPEQAGQRHHPEDLHITLVFLGTVAAGQHACIEQVGGGIDLRPFTLHLDRVDYWEQPQILCLSASSRPAPLISLVQQLWSGLAGCGFKVEKRAYKPHVTLVRKAKKRLHARLDSPIEWPASEFVLAGAAAGEKPPRYQVIKRWSL